MNLEQKNILIASFMDCSIESGYFNVNGKSSYKHKVKGLLKFVPEWRRRRPNGFSGSSDRFADTLKFHKSWDWLMPVIQKCYDEISPMLDTGQNHKDENLIGDITTELLDGRINECYEAVVKAIEWYNQKI